MTWTIWKKMTKRQRYSIISSGCIIIFSEQIKDDGDDTAERLRCCTVALISHSAGTYSVFVSTIEVVQTTVSRVDKTRHSGYCKKLCISTSRYSYKQGGQMIINLAFVDGKHVYWIENEISKWKINPRFSCFGTVVKIHFSSFNWNEWCRYFKPANILSFTINPVI